MTVIWSNYLSNCPPTTDREVALYESLVGVSFPADYVAAVKAHAGKVTDPEVIPLGRGNTPFGPLFFISDDRKHPQWPYNALNAWDALNDRFADGDPRQGKLVPFATNTAHGYFCFDFTNPEPQVVFVDLEVGPDEAGAIFGLASSFTELLGLLTS